MMVSVAHAAVKFQRFDLPVRQSSDRHTKNPVNGMPSFPYFNGGKIISRIARPCIRA
jgi:hypothetical protein